jgi:hypothetical protein
MKKTIILISFLVLSFAGYSQTTTADLIQFQFGLNGGINIRDTLWKDNINSYCIQFIDKTRVDSLQEYVIVNGVKSFKWLIADTIPAGTYMAGNFTRFKGKDGVITNGNPRVRYYLKK